MRETNWILALTVLLMAGCDQSLPRGSAGTAFTAPGTAAAPIAGAPAPGPVALNPAHGMPGHRCDLAVGAPLNATAAPALNRLPSLPSTAVPGSPAAALAAGINPSGNQPGNLPANLPGVTAPNLASLVNQPGPATAQVQSQVLNPIANPTATSQATGLNPKHGEPGHRCDIAVGAPLNSAPAAKTGNAGTQPLVTTTSSPAAAVKPASGLNPKHGQPGHRCDIAVGAPLDSKPVGTTTSQTTTTSQPSPATQPSAGSPAPLVLAPDSATANTSFKPVQNTAGTGLNPKHGEPGHRCDLAVGAPLNSKPNQ